MPKKQKPLNIDTLLVLVGDGLMVKVLLPLSLVIYYIYSRYYIYG